MRVGLVIAAACVACAACGSDAAGHPSSPAGSRTPAASRTPVISPAPDGATALACRTSVRNVEIAAEAYYARHAGYPSGIDDARHSPTTLVGGGYLRQAPDDPGYTITLTSAGGQVEVRGDLFGGKVTRDCSG